MQAHTIMPISTELSVWSADFNFCVVSSFDGSVARPCVETFSDVNVVVCVALRHFFSSIVLALFRFINV